MKTYLHKYWQKKIREIKSTSLNSIQCNKLFHGHVSNLAQDHFLGKISLSEFNKVSADLELAYSISLSNFKKFQTKNSFFRKIEIKFKNLIGIF